ncbi:hypothetical protein ACFWD7_28010 [Streptomyces mirabilis]|uniref:hypothetical protein n=1 Tax=Streptomyces mirabilis TaxID=68239 RepID=UPI0036A08AAD
MPDRTLTRHAPRQQDHGANSRTLPVTSLAAPFRPFELIETPEAQEIHSTASRQLRRAGDFLSAARYMVRHHPKAGPTTLRLAAAFASRMHRSQHGHVPFNVPATVRELGLSRRTVLTHARYLRELGLIVWVEHGSKRNVLRTRHGSDWQPGHGYRGTATLYAPVAPPAWDHAQGHRIRGHGYRARLIGYTQAGRRRAVTAAQRSARSRCTPSVVGTSAPSRLQVVERAKKNTSRTRKARPAHPAARVTPAECHQAITLTQQLQREVWWLYDACSRRIAYALRPLIRAGWTVQQLAAELTTWGVPAHLQDPAAYIHHEIGRRQRLAELPPTTSPSARDPHADDGTRYDTMLHDREQHYAPAWQRYDQQLRPTLRRQLAQVRDRQRQQAAAAAQVYRPVLRESEAAFLASLPLDSWSDAPTPREIYAARAHRRPPARGQVLRADDPRWLEHLRDHAMAAQACENLRAHWATEQERAADAATHGAPDNEDSDPDASAPSTRPGPW